MLSKDNFGYVYMTTNLINGKKYIGKHKSKKFNKWYKGSGILITNAMKKYGKTNFYTQILQWCKTEYELLAREKAWILMYNAVKDPNFYNISYGETGPHKFSEETRQIMRDKKLGKHLSEEHKAKIGNSLRGRPGRPMTQEHKEMLMKINTGRVMPEEERKRRSIIMKNSERVKEKNKELGAKRKGLPGKPLSEETKEKIRQANLGKKLSEETKIKIGESSKNIRHGKLPYETVMGIVKDADTLSFEQLKKKYNISLHSIQSILYGETYQYWTKIPRGTRKKRVQRSLNNNKQS